MRDHVRDQRLLAQIGETTQRPGDEADGHGAEEDHPVGVVREELGQAHEVNSRKESSSAVTSYAVRMLSFVNACAAGPAATTRRLSKVT